VDAGEGDYGTSSKCPEMKHGPPTEFSVMLKTSPRTASHRTVTPGSTYNRTGALAMKWAWLPLVPCFVVVKT
jgi:hypothetical protein